MHIAFVTDTYEGLSGGNVSGKRFVDALRERHEVTVISTDPPGPGMVQVPGFRMVDSRAMRENRFMFGWPRRSVLEGVFARADVVHVQFPFRLGHGAVRLAGAMGLPRVAAFHVQPQNLLYDINVRSQAAADLMYRVWIHNVFQPCEAVIVPSSFGCRRLRAHGLTTSTWLVPNGARLLLPRRTERAGPPYLLLCVGRLSREKRQDVVIDGVARCRHRQQIRLVIAGAGPLESILRTRAERRRLPVEFGFVSDERLARLYDEASLLVHASEVELEGMAVVDAMAAGLPALVASAPESASAGLAAGPEFLFPAGDSAGLAECIDHLLDDAALRASGARRSFKYTEENDFEHSMSRLERIYEMVLEGRVAPPYSLGCSPGS